MSSVFDEPHLRPAGKSDGPREIDHSVWEEPTLKGRAAAPEAETYAGWYRAQRARVTPEASRRAMWTIAAVSGPFAVIGALFQFDTVAGILAIVLFGPVTEEVMKVAALGWVVERRPFMILTRRQIVATAALSGLAFAIIENLMYQFVYLKDPSVELLMWRWTVCVALHLGCSAIAGYGLSREWARATSEERRPAVSRALKYLVIAIVVHGLYNGGVTLAAGLDYGF